MNKGCTGEEQKLTTLESEEQEIVKENDQLRMSPCTDERRGEVEAHTASQSL